MVKGMLTASMCCSPGHMTNPLSSVVLMLAFIALRMMSRCNIKSSRLNLIFFFFFNGYHFILESIEQIVLYYYMHVLIAMHTFIDIREGYLWTPLNFSILSEICRANKVELNKNKCILNKWMDEPWPGAWWPRSVHRSRRCAVGPDLWDTRHTVHPTARYTHISPWKPSHIISHWTALSTYYRATDTQ